jgi:carboxylate-amine ligase
VVAAATTGATFGVEEEFHLVDTETLALTGDHVLAAAAMSGSAGGRVHAEIATSQLETATGICSSLEELRAELRRARAEAAGAAGRAGLGLLAASTHPFGSWRDQEMTRCARYDALVERYAVLPFQQDICGCHVHVGVADLETAVAVMDRARPYLPVLLALTGSSPFHDGIDTGYDSYRTQWFARWPITGTPDRLGSADRFRAVVAGMAAAGAIADASNLYWDVRPSMRYPTVEFRVADVCTDIDDAVLHAGLVRSLVRVLAGRAARDEPCPDPPSELLRVARWRAARHGVGGQLFDPLACTLIDARLAVRRLFAELEEDLRAHDEWDELVGLAQQVLQRGTSATVQRRTLVRTGDPRAVAAALMRASAP